jgi:microcin C transport system substrate-binding protein
MLDRALRVGVLATLIVMSVSLRDASAGAEPPRHGLAMYGEPKYPPDFDHFDYVEPAAPKGGTVVLSAFGGFDTLNPFTIRGVAAAGVANTFDTLMTAALDEPFTQYPLVAESIELPDDRAWVAFTLRPEARFHDGEPIKVDDVIFTLELLRKAHPFYRAYYANVSKVEQTGERTVRFTFAPGDNRELPLILGQLPVLPKHYWQSRTFDRTTLEAPLGSGPYRIARVDPGRSVTYERVPDYWGKDLAVNIGRFNFGAMRYDYYLDPTVALQAFNGGLVDFRIENVAKNWGTAYDGRLVEAGRIKKEEIQVETPAGMQGFVFNTRRPLFSDSKVRSAIAHAFDFEWANAVLFYGAYQRADSYFENSDLEAEGLPSEAELKILEPLRGQIPAEVFTGRYSPPSAGSRSAVRDNLLKARDLLEEAGWVIRDGRRVNAATGQPLAFTILLNSPSMERVALPFIANLRRLGIDARVRTVDTAQYQNRISEFDFDMTTAVWGQSLSPGNEQRDFWTTGATDRDGSRNYAGIRSDAVDHLVDLLIAANTREDLRTRAAALDRVLLWGHYVIPHWYAGMVRVAYWDKMEHPRDLPPYGIAFDAWWINQVRSGK